MSARGMSLIRRALAWGAAGSAVALAFSLLAFHRPKPGGPMLFLPGDGQDPAVPPPPKSLCIRGAQTVMEAVYLHEPQRRDGRDPLDARALTRLSFRALELERRLDASASHTSRTGEFVPALSRRFGVPALRTCGSLGTCGACTQPDAVAIIQF